MYLTHNLVNKRIKEVRMVGITLNAKNYRCICGKQGEFLNITFGAKYGNALCEKCRDTARKELKSQKR